MLPTVRVSGGSATDDTGELVVLPTVKARGSATNGKGATNG